MCGIAGYRFLAERPDTAREDLARSIASLAHRGPDDRGLWQEDGVGFAHARLSILDLSPLGHQPMLSADGRWAMVYNGEVYNFRALRRELESLGQRFGGIGDAEVILGAFAQWGVQAVERFVGMFAIALWHRPSASLHLLRDRLGVKPLYYAFDGKRLLFGSELKAIRAFDSHEPAIDRAALADYLRYGYIAQPRSIYQGVAKLPPAHRLELDADGALRVIRYWSAADAIGRGAARSEDDLVDELEALAIDAFRLRLIADVPVGVFLSGGIDSSLLAAILQGHAGERIETFTIGFGEDAYDESPYARRVAEHLGTAHHERRLHADEARRMLPQWGDLYDEPFGDSSGIPTLLVSQVAAERVKVVLSADGGDELFSGYSAYATTLERQARLHAMPVALRRATSGMTSALQVARLDDWLGGLPWLGETGHKVRDVTASRLRRIDERLGAQGIGQLHDQASSFFRPGEVDKLIGASARTRPLADVYPGEAGEQIALWDLHHYLPEDILAKVDRATMRTSIEGREPLLDHRLVEFAVGVPFRFKRGALGPKHLLRRLLYRYVPRALVDRPKKGFSIPLWHWLRGELAPLLDEHLSPARVAAHGLLDPGLVQGYVARFRRGDPSVAHKVWLLLALQMWQRRWMQSCA
jgi:asparagine synthase (glutamine-hydrolysing)